MGRAWIDRLRERLRGWIGTLRRRWPVASVFALALIALSYQYCTTIYHRDQELPRGGGKYLPLLAVQDGHKMYLQVMSVVLDGRLDITDEVEEFGYVGHRWKTADRRPIYPHAIGPIMVWAPAFAAAHGASKVANLFGADIPSHGYTLFHQRIVYFTSVLLAWLTALIGYRTARKLLGGTWIPALAAFGVLFGTNLHYYAVYRPDYGHAVSAFACALFFSRWATTTGDLAWRRFAILGALLGAAALARIANLFFGICIAIELAVLLAQSPAGERLRRAPRLFARGAAALGVALLVFVPQLLVWKFHYESGLLSPPHGGDYVHLGRPMLVEFLFSSHNGFLSTHPLAYLGAVGLAVAPRRARLAALGMLAGVALIAYVNSCVYDWWAMGSYGARRMCSTSAALVVGLAAAMALANRAVAKVPRWPRRAFALFVVTWFAIWNLSYADTARSRVRSEPVRMCCKEVPDVMADLAEPIYERIGNPFALPASWLWARRWDVPVDRFDHAVIGTYAARPTAMQLAEGFPATRMFPWNIPGVNFEPWLARGLGPRQRYRSPETNKWVYFRWTTATDAAVFVPLFLPCDHRFQLPLRLNLAPDDPPQRVRLRWNRELIVFDEMVGPGWTTARFTVPESYVERGTNMLELVAEPRPHRATGEPPLPIFKGDGNRPVALAVRMMTIWIEDPHR